MAERGAAADRELLSRERSELETATELGVERAGVVAAVKQAGALRAPFAPANLVLRLPAAKGSVSAHGSGH